MATTPVFSPQGQFGYVSPDQLENALASGGKRAVPMLNPQGQRGWVPEDMVDDARKKGGVLASEPGQSPTELANQALAGTGISVNPPPQPLKTMQRQGTITGSTFTLPGNVDVSNPGGPTVAQQRQAALARRTPQQQAQVVKAIAQEAPLNLTGLDLGNAAVGAKNLATKGHRAEGAAQVLGAAGNTMAPAIGPASLEAPVATGVGMLGGLLAGKGARKLVQAGGGGQGAQDLAEQGTNLVVPSLLGMFGMGGGRAAEAKAQESLVPADEAINNAATKTGEIVQSIPSAARNNPVTNLALGPNPNAIEPVAALTKAVRPRNSIQNFSDHAARALPDARRAADTLGIDTNNMTLKDAEDAVVQGKKDVWNEFQQNHLNPVKDVGVDASPIAARIQQVANGMTDIQKGRMGPLVDQINNAVADYAGKNMSVGDIETRLQEVNNELRSQQAQFKVNEMNLRNDPRFAYKYAELDGLRQAERQAFDNMTGPGAADLKQRYGSLKVMEDVLDRRINVADRANVSKLYETGGRLAGVGDVLKGIGAREPLTMAAGVAKMRMGKNAQQLNDPDFLIQQAFSKTTPRPQPGINGNLPIIRGQLPSPVPGLNGYVYGSQPTSPEMISPATPSKVNVEPTTRAQRLGLLLPKGPTDWRGEPFNNQLPAPEPPEGGTQRANFVVQRDPRTGRMVKMYVTSGGGKQLGAQAEEAAPAEQKQPSPLGLLSPKAGAAQEAASAVGKRAQSQQGSANLGMFLPQRPKVSPLGFFSKAEDVAMNKLPNAGTGEQFASTLRGNGVKAEEMKWSGLDDLLKQNRVTKQQVLDHLAQNNVQVQEVTKGGQQPLPWADYEEKPGKHVWATNVGSKDYSITSSRGPDGHDYYYLHLPDGTGRSFAVLDNAQDYAERHASNVLDRGTKFSNYQLPGGSNYRELLLTTPEKFSSTDAKGPFRIGTSSSGANYDVVGADRRVVLENAPYLDAERWVQQAKSGSAGQNFRGGHFDEPNVLAHVRFNDRFVPDPNGPSTGNAPDSMTRSGDNEMTLQRGKPQRGYKTLFVEEVQSDWHQKGRKQGYVDQNQLPAGSEIVNQDGRFWVRAPGIRQFIGSGATREEALADAKSSGHAGVPDAPFKNTWHELAMKRMLRYAAENGYDRLAWTTGEQQAARYDLSKQLSEVSYNPKSNQLFAYDKNGNTALTETVPPEKLDDYIGKEAAQRLLNQEPQPSRNDPSQKLYRLTGLDLKVGGEGMKGFYDKILPDFMNKYGKKWGARVQDGVLNGSDDPNLDVKVRNALRNFGPDSPQYRELLNKNNGFTMEPYDENWRPDDNFVVRDGSGRYLDPRGNFVNDREEALLHDRESAEAELRKHNITSRIHSMDITPSMKQSVMQEGQPLFSHVPPMLIPSALAGGAALAGYAHKKLKQAPSPLPFLRK